MIAIPLKVCYAADLRMQTQLGVLTPEYLWVVVRCEDPTAIGSWIKQEARGKNNGAELHQGSKVTRSLNGSFRKIRGTLILGSLE